MKGEISWFWNPFQYIAQNTLNKCRNRVDYIDKHIAKGEHMKMTNPTIAKKIDSTIVLLKKEKKILNIRIHQLEDCLGIVKIE